MTIKLLTLWAIARPTRHGMEILPDTVARTRTEAIKSWLDRLKPSGKFSKFRYWRERKGYKSVKVSVLPKLQFDSLYISKLDFIDRITSPPVIYSKDVNEAVASELQKLMNKFKHIFWKLYWKN